MQKPEIYIHLGMSRTGSTFVQTRIFPHLEGIHYERRLGMVNSIEMLKKAEPGKYLISHEVDNRKIGLKLPDFARNFRYAHPFMVIRRHDEWLVSQYRRYLKNGRHLTFKEFFDLENDEGFIKKEHLLFFNFIQTAEKSFDHKPMVLLYDELRSNPVSFTKKIADFMGVQVDTERLNFTPRHVSHNDKQLTAFYRLTGILDLRRNRKLSSGWKTRIFKTYTEFIRYPVFFIANILPRRFFSKPNLFPTKDQLKAIRDYYEKDWQQCLSYASKSKTGL